MLRRAWRSVRLTPGAHLWTVLLCTAAFLLAGAAALFSRNTERLLSSWGTSGQLVAYLRPNAAESDAQQIVAFLRKVPTVEHVDYVAPEETRRRLIEALGAQSPLLDGVEPAFFPASIEARFAKGAWKMARVSGLARRLEQIPVVERVDLAGEWIDKLARAKTVLVGGATTIAVAALVIGLAILFGTMRLQVLSRAREIAILRMCGATTYFIRVPFLFVGAMTALLAAGLAVTLLRASFDRAVPMVVEHVGFAFLGRPMFFAPHEFLWAIVGAALLGALATSRAVNRHLG